jgi:hypothetical protein
MFGGSSCLEMSAKRKTVLLFTAVTVCVVVVVWLVIPGLMLSAAQRRYPLGTTLQEAKLRLREPYHVSTYTGVVFPEPATDRQKEIYPRYIVVAQKEGLYMEFNHHEKLIRLELLHTIK